MKNSSFIFAIALIVLLTACGGGGSDSNTAPVSTPEVNEKPVIDDIVLNVDAGAKISVMLSATDPNASDVLRYAIVSAPVSGELVLDQQTAFIEYTAPSDNSSSDSFSVEVSDGELSAVALVTVNIVQPVLNAADVIAPEPVKIVSASSLTIGNASVYWIASTDADTAASDLRYDIHVATNENFTPDPTSLVATVQESIQASLSNLPAGNELFVKMVTRDTGGNTASSEPLAFNQAQNASAAVLKPNVAVTTDNQLHLSSTTVSDDQIVLTGSANSDSPEVGQIILSQDQDGYFRKVTAVDQSGNQTTVTTEDAYLGDVFDEITLTDTTLLFRDSLNPSASTVSSKSTVNKTTRYTLATSTKPAKKVEFHSWPNSGLATKTESVLSSTSKVTGRTTVQKTIGRTTVQKTTVDGDVTIEAALVDNNEPLVVTVGDSVEITLAVSVLPDGIEDDLVITGTDVTSDYDGFSTLARNSYNYLRYSNTNDIYSQQSTLTFRASKASPDQQVITYSVYIKDLGCASLFDLCHNEVVTLEVPVLIIDPDPSIPSNNTIIANFDFANEITAEASMSSAIQFSFEPTLTSEFDKGVASLKSAKLVLNSPLSYRADLDLKFSGEYSNRDNPKVIPLNVFPGGKNAKTYYRVFVAGGLPVVMVVELSFNAEAWVEVTGEMAISQTVSFNADANVNIEYDGSNWIYTMDPTLGGGYTADINTAAGVMGQLRLVPNLQVKFYEKAKANLSLEPYLQSELGLSGNVQAQLEASYNGNATQNDIDAVYALSTAELVAGVECNFYAGLEFFDKDLLRYPADGELTFCNPQATIFTLPYSNDSDSLKVNNEQVQWDVATQSTIVTVDVQSTLRNGDGLISNLVNIGDIEWIVFPEPLTIINTTDAVYYPAILGDSTDRTEVDANISFLEANNYTIKLFYAGQYTPRPWGQQIQILNYTVAQSTIDRCNIDCDNDGIPNTAEITYGLDPNNAADASADADNDGVSNLAEHEAGTDPNEPSDNELAPPVITVESVGDRKVTLTWSYPEGVTNYTIYYAEESFGSLDDIANFSSLSGSGTFQSYPAGAIVRVGLTRFNNNTTYYFVVTHSNSIGQSAPSNEVSATPVAEVAPPTDTKFDYPIGDRGRTIDGDVYTLLELLEPEKNTVYEAPESVTIPDNYTRGKFDGSPQWRNAQDVGSFNGGSFTAGLHPGEDWNLNGGNDDAGESVYAVADGKVVLVRSTFNSSLDLGGWTIVIEHSLTDDDNDRVYSIYSHLTATGAINQGVVADELDLDVKEGDNVTRGQVIGILARGSGDGVSSMTAFPAHLHFEMRKPSEPITASTIDLWPQDNGNGYYTHDQGDHSKMSSGEIVTAMTLMANEVGIIDPSDFIDQHRYSSAEISAMQISGVSPLSITSGEPQTFTISGVNLPPSLAASVSGADCGAIQFISSTTVNITCTVATAGQNIPFYIAANANGRSINGGSGIVLNGGTPGPIDLDEGLIGYYPFDGSLNDYSGNENNNVAVDSVVYDDGVLGQAAIFDNTDVMNLGDVPINPNAITLSAWVKLDVGEIKTGHSNIPFFDKHEAFHLIIENEILQFSIGIGVEPKVQADALPVENIWSHIAATYDGTLMRLYLDGELVGEKAYTESILASSYPLYIASDETGNFVYMAGSIDDARIYDRALSYAEVSQLSKNLDRGLVAHYEFENNSYDSTTNKNHGVEYGGVSYDLGVVGQAAMFDGIDDYLRIPNKSHINFLSDEDFTISFWVLASQNQLDLNFSDNDVIEKWSGGEGYPYAIRYMNQTHVAKDGQTLDRGTIQAGQYNFQTKKNNWVGSTVIDREGYNHIIMKKKSGRLYLYENKVLVSSRDSTLGNIKSESDLFLAARGTLKNYFKGSLDDLRIYNRAINDTEIYALYNLKNDLEVFYDDFSTLDPLTYMWEIGYLKSCCPDGKLPNHSKGNGRLNISLDGVSDGYIGIADGADFYPKGIVLAEDFYIETNLTELFRVKNNSYKDNSGISIQVRNNNGDVPASIGIRGNYSGYFYGHNYGHYQDIAYREVTST